MPIPSYDGTPGAKEANVIGFLERALTTFHAFRLEGFRLGLADLNQMNCPVGTVIWPQK